MGDDDLLAQQQAYYEARAPEYDDWWLRRGRYDQGDEQRTIWRSQIDELRRWLRGLGPLGRVLELAAGTGNWTAELVGVSEAVVAVDGSAEVLAINADKIPAGAPVDLVQADVFDYEPEGRFDTVFFSFWLSHVPVDRRRDHWRLVRDALGGEGRVVMIDNAHPREASRAGYGRLHAGHESMETGGREARTLADGRRFEIVKHYWSPAELEAEARTHGVELEAEQTDHYFLYAEGVLSGAEAP